MQPAASIPPPLTVRRAIPNDAAAVIAHVLRIIDEPDRNIPMDLGEFTYTVEQEAQLLADIAASNHSLYLVAELHNQLVGILNCTAGTRASTRHAATLGLTVHRDFRNQGIGSALLTAAITWARTTHLTRLELLVYTRNPAVRLYQRHGFTIEGTKRRAIHQHNQYHDEHLMALLL